LRKPKIVHDALLYKIDDTRQEGGLLIQASRCQVLGVVARGLDERRKLSVYPSGQEQERNGADDKTCDN
jgi:hypothetical protein